MNNKRVKSKLAGMISSLEVIISNASEQTRELKELIRFRDELKELVEKVDNGWRIDRSVIILLVRELASFLHSFISK